MKTKNKLIIMLISLITVLCICIVSISFVLASVNQRVSSQIKVTYIADKVTINVSANKYFKNDTPIPFSGGTDGVVRFDMNSQTNQTLTTTRTDLTNPFYYVVYEYIFENIGGNDISASLTVNGLENLEMYVDNASTTQKENVYTEFDKTDYTKSSSIQGVTIQTEETVYVYVVIAVERLANDASYLDGFVWTMTSI